MEDSALTNAQAFLLQATLHGITSTALLSRHASVSRGLAVEVQQARDAIVSHRQTGEPQLPLLKEIVRSATAAGVVAQNRGKVDLGGKVALALAPIAAIHKNSADIDGILNTSQTELEAIIKMLPEHLELLFTNAWQCAPCNEIGRAHV